MAGQRGRTAEQGARRRAAGRPSEPAAPRRALPGGPAIPAVLAVGLPLIGAAVDETSGPGMGAAFLICSVLGTALAAGLSTRNGWWWVLAGSPLVVLAVEGGVELLVNPDKYEGNHLATGAARWLVLGFPVMALAAAAAVLVIAVRTIRGRRRQHD
ncbi:DUF6542 domain-containing protein [Streptomyces sp. NRRL WC-3742]|uniref:DUF6542 domain-containing protein n=1 Tax=Streptomyces sp. NRRL WC-3742 TaxID=1463934 RepID=UPI00068B1F4D|nr:DUF6542 domain-containing protein [Streptomyces sp. NRRL WC-3742]